MANMPDAVETENGESNVVVSAFTEDEAQRLTGISLSQLRYWSRTGFFSPGFKTDPFGSELRNPLYSFRDVVCLQILNAIRNESRVSLHHLREVKARLAHMGDDVWAKTTLFVLNRKVVFENPETKAREEITTGQKVLQIPLEVMRAQMSERVRQMRRRDAAGVGKIEKRRSVVQNQPVIAGTRIQVASIKAFHEAGYSNQRIIEEYPSLTDEDIRAALSYGKAA